MPTVGHIPENRTLAGRFNRGMIKFDYGFIRFIDLLRYRIESNITQREIEDCFYSDNASFYELEELEFLINFSNGKFIMVEFTRAEDIVYIIDS